MRQPPLVLRVDQTRLAGAPPADPSALPEPWRPLAGWAGLDLTPAPLDPPTTRCAVAGAPDRLGIALQPEGDTPTEVRLTPHLRPGVWRLDAGILHADGAAGFWRLESVFLPASGAPSKTLTVAPGDTLFVRAVETLAGAEARTRDAVQAARPLPRAAALTERVGQRLAQARIQTARGQRDRVVRSVHDALQYLGQAEALARNADLPGEPWDALTEALSEVSAAACNLLPRQECDGARMTLTLRNAGARTLTAVALSPSPRGERRVFRTLPPGRVVRAVFPLPASEREAPCGWAQYILHGGAAALPLRVDPRTS